MEKNSEKIVMYRPGIEPGSPDYQSKKRGGGLQNIAVMVNSMSFGQG